MVPSFWKSHDHEVGLPDEVSVNLTVSGADPDLGEAVKSAFGAWCGRIYPETVIESLLAAVAACTIEKISRQMTRILIIFRFIPFPVMQLLL
jgi:hypothetical protein